MEKLILASSGQFITSPEVDKFLPKPLSQSKILYITTASKVMADTSFVERTRQKFDELNLSYVDYDIVGKTADELKMALDDVDIAYLEGGNTFYLLKAIRETGFGDMIKEALGRGIVYWGVSAGSYVAAQSILPATISDRFDRYGVTDYSAMNLVPFLIKAHYVPAMLGALTDKARESNAPWRVLNDSQAVLVADGEVQLVGEGDELIL